MKKEASSATSDLDDRENPGTEVPEFSFPRPWEEYGPAPPIHQASIILSDKIQKDLNVNFAKTLAKTVSYNAILH